jgi:hypothetical protein
VAALRIPHPASHLASVLERARKELAFCFLWMIPFVIVLAAVFLIRKLTSCFVQCDIIPF